jgi:hypothetical protein
MRVKIDMMERKWKKFNFSLASKQGLNKYTVVRARLGTVRVLTDRDYNGNRHRISSFKSLATNCSEKNVTVIMELWIWDPSE